MLPGTGLTVCTVSCTECSVCGVTLLSGKDSRNAVAVTKLLGGSMLKIIIVEAQEGMGCHACFLLVCTLEVECSHSYKQYASSSNES